MGGSGFIIAFYNQYGGGGQGGADGGRGADHDHDRRAGVARGRPRSAGRAGIRAADRQEGLAQLRLSACPAVGSHLLDVGGGRT